jgi:hypothetical protein
MPRREEMLLEPVNKMGAKGDKTPALLSGKRIEDKKCRIFSGGFRFYCCGLCWRTVTPPGYGEIGVVMRPEFPDPAITTQEV